MHLTPAAALQLLSGTDKRYTTLYTHGSLVVEIYKPVGQDAQIPHDRDEVYIIISGTGEFRYGNEEVKFNPGDFLFVPAGMEHRFINFSEDFCTWVLFYGPSGGEQTAEAF